jgi:hypothetical protein
MKKVIISAFLLLIYVINSSGQWYVKKYQINDINFLSKVQLEESLQNSKNKLLFAGCTVTMGGAAFLISKYLKPGMSDDPTVIEQLLGDDGVNKVGMITGAGLIIWGSIASIVHLGRIGRIRSVINKNYPSVGSLEISPAIILNGYARSFCAGFSLNYSF